MPDTAEQWRALDRQNERLVDAGSLRALRDAPQAGQDAPHAGQDAKHPGQDAPHAGQHTPQPVVQASAA